MGAYSDVGHTKDSFIRQMGEMVDGRAEGAKCVQFQDPHHGHFLVRE
jgi:hypothetical protein